MIGDRMVYVVIEQQWTHDGATTAILGVFSSQDAAERFAGQTSLETYTTRTIFALGLDGEAEQRDGQTVWDSVESTEHLRRS